MAILLFIDDVAGSDTENANGVVVSNKGLITGEYSWRLLCIFILIFLITSVALIIYALRNGSKRFH